MNEIIKRGSKLIPALAILYCTWLMLLIIVPYVSLKPGVDFLATKQFIYHIIHWRLSFYVHVFTGVFTLLCGLVQLNGTVLRRFPRLHRISGYIYVVDVLLVTGPAALVMSWYANGGWPAKISFLLLSFCWLSSTALAFKSALKKRFISHGNWMLRSYALTLSAITLRMYAYIIAWVGIDIRPVEEYRLIAWLSWVPNLLIAEWLIRKGFIRDLLKDNRSIAS